MSRRGCDTAAEGTSDVDLTGQSSMTSADNSSDDELCKFSDSKRAQKLLETANQSWQSRLYTDVAVSVGSQKFLAHRLVLASLSDYFPSLFKFDEKDSGEVTVHNVEPEIFSIILKYAYTGEVEVNRENVQSLLLASDYLGVSHVKQTCIRFMTNNLDVENLCDVLIFAIDYPLSDLVDNCCQFLKRNLEEVSSTIGFLQLSLSFLVQFFEDDNLIIWRNDASLKSRDREEAILTAVLRYVSRKGDLIPGDTERLIQVVRFNLIPEETIINKFLVQFTFANSNELVRKYLDLRTIAITHQKSAGSVNSRINETVEAWGFLNKWLHPRRLAVFEVLERRRRYASDGQIIRTPRDPEYLHNDSDLEIKQIEIWVRTWEGTVVIRGLKLTYRGGSDECQPYLRGDCSGGPCQHSVELESGELIIGVTIRSGYLIDCLSFQTNKGRQFGPFGGPGGRQSREVAPSGDALSYLFDINCDSVYTQGGDAIFNLMLRWILFT